MEYNEDFQPEAVEDVTHAVAPVMEEYSTNRQEPGHAADQTPRHVVRSWADANTFEELVARQRQIYRELGNPNWYEDGEAEIRSIVGYR